MQITLNISPECRELFDECARFLLEGFEDDAYHDTALNRERHLEIVALVAQLDGKGPLKASPRIAWAVLEDSLGLAQQAIYEVSWGEADAYVAELEEATGRLLALAREFERVETLGVPAGLGSATS